MVDRHGVAAMTPPLIPPGARAEVENVMKEFTLAEIGKMYRAEGFELPDGFEPTQGEMRRSTVRAFESTADLTSIDGAHAWLRVVERLLDELEYLGRKVDHQWPEEARDRLIRELQRADIHPNERDRLTLPRRNLASPSLATAPTESGIRLAIARLERLDAEPEEVVGAAKDLVEATIKHALTELAEPFGPTDDVPALAKKLHQRLRLDPAAIAPTTRGAATILGILGGFARVPHGLAELRNEGYGTGHGQARRIAGLRSRHADFASRAAVAYATFIIDTLTDPEAPWR
jgi:hypothetical protein